MRAELELPLLLSEIISAIGGFCASEIKVSEIRAISTDTRELNGGDLFIALPGKSYDGESFCTDAESAGAICVSKIHKSGILVKDTTRALCKIASLYRKKLKNLKSVIAITGSVGKTTTKELLKRLLSHDHSVHATKGNYNNQIGVAYTILTCPANADTMIVEMGMNHRGEIKESSLMAKPSIAIITRIGTAHIGNLGSKEMIAKAKMEITEGLTENGTLIIPYGEPLLKPSCKHKTVSTSDAQSDFSLIPIEASTEGTRFILKQERHPATVEHVSIFGLGNLNSLAFAAACALEIGIDAKDLHSVFSSISFDITRQKVIYWQDRCIIDDSYNASFESVIAAFDFLNFFRGRRLAVLGDILELGSETESIHFKIGAEAVSHGIDTLFLFGVYSPFIARGALCAGMEHSKIFVNSDCAAPHVTENCVREQTKPGDVILFKASHQCNLSSMIERIKSNERDDYAG